MHLTLLLSVLAREGRPFAAEFAKRGRKVAIVERSDKMYGGTCVLILAVFRPKHWFIRLKLLPV